MPERKQTPDVLSEILGLATDQSPLRTEDPRPVCWEHRVVSFQNYRGWRPRYVEGAEVTNWMAGPLLHDFLNEMGAEGWEVAGAASGHPLYGSADGYQVIFKRPQR